LDKNSTISSKSIVLASVEVNPTPKRSNAVFCPRAALLNAAVTEAKSLPVPAEVSNATDNNVCAFLASKVALTNEVKAGLSWSSRTPVVFCKLVINPAVLITA